ncbi:FAD-binding oxidoreductase [Fimbriiglobus ruber]|uniref:Glycolate dehydrogenase n=1 Tax=Fimbriiglobus ruber TaxID=1908690 RepID=A0A225DL91_9BACT|nr:FAD-binding oxidoreductase [Fimbriiglobus ruber]OWK42260.1 Glycolate dehydrogenase [Fimbriiglobus ruber]
MTDALTIDDFGPLPVRRPATVSDLGGLVRETAAAGQGVYPVGGGTHLGLGLPPSKPGIAVDTRGLDQVIDYPARDMTITVRAGVTIESLQKTLAAEGQWLPVDVPDPARATLGGALAANLSGPRRLSRGTLRDYVIGISFVADDGVEVKGGGRVVKNVAGYDLMKLQVGALGTLGIVTQVTLKVTPKVEDQAIIAFGVNAAAVGPTLDRLHASAARPAALELLNAAAAKVAAAAAGIRLPEFDPWVIVAGFEEKAATVTWQLASLRDELKTAPVRDVTEFRGPACSPIWAALTGLQTTPDSRFTFKATVLPSKMGVFATAAAAAHPDLSVHAHALNGIAFGHLAGDATADRASALLAALAPTTADANGSLTVRLCPPEWKKVLPIWGAPRGDRAVMRAVKAALDPKNVFNPGRLFVDA